MKKLGIHTACGDREGLRMCSPIGNPENNGNLSDYIIEDKVNFSPCSKNKLSKSGLTIFYHIQRKHTKRKPQIRGWGFYRIKTF